MCCACHSMLVEASLRQEGPWTVLSALEHGDQQERGINEGKAMNWCKDVPT